MAARYREIADDLRTRVGAGEWSVGGRLPTIGQLMEHYDVRGLNTIRAAQQLLVDEGILETVAGVGAFVRTIPDLYPDLADLAAHLRAVRRDLDLAIAAATARRPTGRVAAAPADDADLAVWRYQKTSRCRTCGEDLAAVTRGWVSAGHVDNTRASAGHEGHDVLAYLGSSAEEDQDAALLRERWWAHRAHLERSAELLTEGKVTPATGYADRASSILQEAPAIRELGIQLRTTGPRIDALTPDQGPAAGGPRRESATDPAETPQGAPHTQGAAPDSRDATGSPTADSPDPARRRMPRRRHPWWVVEADAAAPATDPVVLVTGGHTSKKAAQAALRRIRAKNHPFDPSVTLEVRHTSEIAAYRRWDAGLNRAVITPGPPE